MIKKRFSSYSTILFFLLLLCPITASTNIPIGDEKIPDSIISLSSGYAIVVDKQHQKIYVFQKNGTFSKVFEAPCSTGQNPGSKQVAGDKKTPNGIFFVTKFLPNPGPPEIYGSMAFPLDYPTISDQRAGRDGNNIWIHGTTKTLLPTQSNGCVVLHESDIQRLAQFIFFNKTPVIISEFLRWVPQDQVSPSKNELEKVLTSWHKAFVEKDIKAIDSLYLQGSEIKGKRREDLNNKIKYLTNLDQHFLLEPRDISILRENNNAVIIFDQIYAVNSNNSFQGFYNKLILEKVKNKWYVTDDATPPPTANKNLAQVNNKQNETKSISNEAVRNLVNKWVTSWKSGNMKTYRSCYASNFQSKGMNLSEWVSYKTTIRQNSDNIRIRIENLQISVDDNMAKASFIQYYSSSIFNSKGKKTLELKKTGNEWKIYKEIM
jgi:murein L,D-transpeptidase YafK